MHIFLSFCCFLSLRSKYSQLPNVENLNLNHQVSLLHRITGEIIFYRREEDKIQKRMAASVPRI
jgi:hypothetical protein